LDGFRWVNKIRFIGSLPKFSDKAFPPGKVGAQCSSFWDPSPDYSNRVQPDYEAHAEFASGCTGAKTSEPCFQPSPELVLYPPSRTVWCGAM
jgi:hypothetical protein